jgi:predicted nucleic-acid-binding protein
LWSVYDFWQRIANIPHSKDTPLPFGSPTAADFTASGAWVSHLVLAETAWVLDAVYDRSAEQIATAIEMLLNHKDLTLQDAEVVASALEHFRSRPVPGFSDCLVVEIARKAGHLPLRTFDWKVKIHRRLPLIPKFSRGTFDAISMLF